MICDQAGCFVQVPHEHEDPSTDERLAELLLLEAAFDARHPSLRYNAGGDS